ncbi:unnamed protein product [Cuscuta campestris]|uniref:DUF2828 domain-containing protein n=1 Tax=Cuscuta campestris TaxID=132261 RepID=A0A484LVA5_9ASTE|nr:unnamed protein product [Cuscuta campestris]
MGLLGPPELRNAAPPPSPPPETNTKPPPSAGVQERRPRVFNPPMGFTENMAATYLSSGDPCLDFFFHVVPDTPSGSLEARLSAAWEHDPLTALKLVFNLRGVRGTGKSDKQGAQQKTEWDKRKLLALVKSSEWKCKGTVNKKKVMYMVPSLPKEERKLLMAKKLIDKYNGDGDFRYLYDRISDFFGEALRADLERLNAGEAHKISLAAKWCPSIDRSFDRSTLLCEAIAQKVFPRMSHPEYEGIEEAHYIYRVRDRLRKEVLVPLRKVLELPETYIGANRWDSIPYNRVASVAMNFYKNKFFKHDGERFQGYLESVEKGEAKIAAGALLPHEIIQALDDGDDDEGEVAELQWKRMVDDLRQRGKLRNCMAICDVSGSMRGTPMEVLVALGLLVSELSEDPWKGKLITFSNNPKLQMIKGDSLREKTSFVTRMEWGMNTDFQKVFDLILKVAVEGKLKREQMIKRLFVFSDMEFDQASSESGEAWETDYKKIKRKFRKKGFGKTLPEIVFWNLRDSMATPVPGSQKGVALVSGFSKNLLKMFFEGDGIIDPVEVMRSAISGEEYQKLAVVD